MAGSLKIHALAHFTRLSPRGKLGDAAAFIAFLFELPCLLLSRFISGLDRVPLSLLFTFLAFRC